MNGQRFIQNNNITQMFADCSWSDKIEVIQLKIKCYSYIWLSNYNTN